MIRCPALNNRRARRGRMNDTKENKEYDYIYI